MIRTGPYARSPAVRQHLGLDHREFIAGFIYVGYPLPGFMKKPPRKTPKDYRAHVTLEPSGHGTTITWHSSFHPKIPGTGRLIQRGLGRFIQHTVRSLASFAEIESVRGACGGRTVSAEQGGKIAFLLYPGLTPLDLIGPLQVMSVFRTFVPGWETVVVGERLEPMRTDAGPSIVPEATFEDVDDPTVIVTPGGAVPTIRQLGNPILHDYLRSVSDTRGGGRLGLYGVAHPRGCRSAPRAARHHPLGILEPSRAFSSDSGRATSLNAG